MTDRSDPTAEAAPVRLRWSTLPAALSPLPDPRRVFVLRLAGASVLGGAFIGLGDHVFHVRTAVLTHAWQPQWDGQALLVYPLFVTAALAMLLVTAVLPFRVPPPSAARCVAEASAFWLAYWTTGRLGVDHPGWLFLLLAATFVARLRLEPNPRAVVAVGALIGLGGCVGEAVVSAIGLFAYVRPDLGGVPLWLFPLYLHGAPAVVALARVVRGDDALAEPIGSGPRSR